MKKLLLTCFLALGIGANAQFTQDFEASTSLPPDWSTIDGGDENSFTIFSNPTESYSGDNVAGILYGETAHDDYLVSPGITVQSGINDRLSFWVKSYDPDYLESYEVKLSTTTKTDGSNFTVTLKPSSLAPKTWTQFSLDLRPYVGQTVYIGFHATDTEKYYLYFDDIISETFPTTPPPCTTINSHTNGSTIYGGYSVFNWTPVAEANEYKLTVGTTSGGSDVYNAIVNSTTQLTTLPSGKTLYAKVVPTNTIGDATGCSEITFTTFITLPYCIPEAITQDHNDYEKISNVSFVDINNSSTSTDIYEDHTSIIGNAQRGSSYPISVTISKYDEADLTSVWIDYNQDGEFADNEKVDLTKTEIATGTITIPGTAKLGYTGMRVITSYENTPTACGDLDYGQIEDYTLNIAEAPTVPTCTTINTPTNGSTINAGNTTFTWDPVAASEYKLTVGTSPGGSDIYNATVESTTKTIDLPVNSTLYAKVVPANTLGNASGCPEITFTTSSFTNYCIPDAIAIDHTDFEKISNVTFANINQSSTSTDGYENFTSIIGNIERDNTYPISVTISGFDDDLTSVWIDYNQDGLFTDSEKVNLTATATATGTITIPASAKLGNTRMRVRINYEDAPTACIKSEYGQTEDYTVNIAAAPTMTVSDVNKTNISIYPNPFTDVLKISDVKDVKSISVNDMSGRQVKSLAPTAEINLSNLNAGLYIVNLKMEDGSVKTFKVIKK